MQNVIRSVALFCEGNEIRPEHLAEFPELFAAPRSMPSNRSQSGDSAIENLRSASSNSATPRAPQQNEGSAEQSPPEGSKGRGAPSSAFYTPQAHSSVSDRGQNGRGANGAELMRQTSEEAANEGMALGDMKRKLEFDAIANAMRQTGGNITKAAALLKMKRPRLSQIVNGDPKLKAIKE